MLRGFRNSFLLAVCFGGFLPGAAEADNTNYVSFFTAENNDFQAYYDLNNQTTDAAGDRLVNVKMDTISDTFRGWIKTYFPGGENAAYAIESFGVDCSGKQVSDHTIVYYDANGFPLTSHDYGAQKKTPITGSLKSSLMIRICGQ